MREAPPQQSCTCSISTSSKAEPRFFVERPFWVREYGPVALTHKHTCARSHTYSTGITSYLATYTHTHTHTHPTLGVLSEGVREEGGSIAMGDPSDSVSAPEL